MAQKPVLCDDGKIDHTNLIGMKIEMVAQNYPSGVILLPRHYRFPPSKVKLLEKAISILNTKAKELRKNEFMQTSS